MASQSKAVLENPFWLTQIFNMGLIQSQAVAKSPGPTFTNMV